MTLKLCTLASGSSGNCIYIGASDGARERGILVDCGMSGKYVLGAMEAAGVDSKNVRGIFVTHEHSDHVSGVGVLSRRLKIPIYANAETWDCMREGLGKLAEENIRVIQTDEQIEVDGMGIRTYAIPHDAANPVGVSVEWNGKKAAVATDLGYFSETVFANIKDADIVLLESNHDVEMLKVGSYPYYLKRRILGNQGHLSNDAAGQALCNLVEAGVGQFLLGHLSRENNFPELAIQTVSGIAAEHRIKVGSDIRLEVAPRSTASSILCV